MFCHCVDGTPKDDPVCWFYALDNKSRDPDNPKIPTDPVFVELRKALTNIVNNDQRTTKGLDGLQTRFVDVAMPITAVQMVGSLGEIYGRVCTKKDVYRHALLFGLNKPEVDVLMEIFHRLAILFSFRDSSGRRGRSAVAPGDVRRRRGGSQQTRNAGRDCVESRAARQGP